MMSKVLARMSYFEWVWACIPSEMAVFGRVVGRFDRDQTAFENVWVTLLLTTIAASSFNCLYEFIELLVP